MNLEYPETMQEFHDRFGTADACRDYLIPIRWPDGFRCPTCAHREFWTKKDGLLRCRSCRRDISITAGTVLHDSRVPLQIWFQAAWFMVSQKHGVSSLGLARVIGMNRYDTTWNLLRKIRSAMVRPGRDRLKGIIEIDEVFIGGIKPGKRGRGAFGKVLVLVAVEDKETSIGRIRITVIPNASHQSLAIAIGLMVEPWSTIRTDGWSGYSGIEKKGYRHNIIERHPTIPGDDPTPLVHRIASLLKRWLLGTHQGGVRPSHLPSYLDEYVFRFNRRTSGSRGKLFHRLMQYLMEIKPKKS